MGARLLRRSAWMAVLLCIACGEEPSRRIGGPTVLFQVSPASAPPGGAIQILGTGFSPVPAENFVFIAGEPALPSAVSVTAAGLLLDIVVPAGAAAGTAEIFVVVDGLASNPLSFTVL